MSRPLSYTSPEALESAVSDYFDRCDTKQAPYTISGLALFLGVTRQTLLNYEKRDEFFDTLSLAKARCEAFAEEHLFSGKGVSGVIFNLRCNYNWGEGVSAQPPVVFQLSSEIAKKHQAVSYTTK